MHANILEHKCKECDDKFSRFDKLKSHVKVVHLKLKDHSCEECGAAFFDKTSLKRHEKGVHLKIKDEECKECGATFSQKSNLTTQIGPRATLYGPWAAWKCPQGKKRPCSLGLGCRNAPFIAIK